MVPHIHSSVYLLHLRGSERQGFALQCFTEVGMLFKIITCMYIIHNLFSITIIPHLSIIRESQWDIILCVCIYMKLYFIVDNTSSTNSFFIYAFCILHDTHLSIIPASLQEVSTLFTLLCVCT